MQFVSNFGWKLLSFSAKFSAQSELNEFFSFFHPAVADENRHVISFFSEGIWTNLEACIVW